MSGSALVTGAVGFVGRSLVAALAGRGRRVIGVSAPPRPGAETPGAQANHADVCHVTGDVRDSAHLCNLMRTHDVQLVVHLAAMTPGATDEAATAQAVLDTNVGGTAAVTQAAIAAGVPRLLLASSVAVYGGGHSDGCRLDEDVAPRPETLYALSKECAERVLRRLGAQSSLDWRIGRLGRVFGPLEYRTGVRATMSQIFTATEAARTRGRVGFARPCVKAWHYAPDAAEALVMLAEAPCAASRVYNLGSPALWSLAAWCELLAAAFPGFDFAVGTSADGRPEIDLNGSTDGGNLSLDRFEREIGPMPSRSLHASFADYMDAIGAAPAWGRYA
jgi:nucleoside-diphosphate-sugar epimerase